jgi:DNA-binding response OmpR family regulator
VELPAVSPWQLEVLASAPKNRSNQRAGLPRLRRAQALPERTTNRKVRRMKKRILIVDDDASVQKSVQTVLEQAGYEVMLAADGQEAIDRFSPDRIDLLILDINLPNKGGWEVFEDLTRSDPCLPIIIVTGLANQCELAVIEGVAALMEKPVAPSVLLEITQRLLAEPKEDRLRRLRGQLFDTRYVPSALTLFLRRLREQATTPYRFKLPYIVPGK